MSLNETTRAAPRTAAVSGPGAGRLGLALVVIATAQLMLVLDDTIVNVALPSMQRSLHIATPHLNWVISFYALAFGGLLLAGGRAADTFGRLRMFRVGVIVFAAASMAGGLARSETVLIAARLVQGGGAAIAAPAALSLLATTFPAGPARTKALGVYGSMAGLGSVVGLLLGGALTTYASWRWVLFINVPIAVAVLAGSRMLVSGEREPGRLDIAGAVTATLSIGSIIYGLTRGNTNGWTDPGTLACFASGAALLVVFFVAERAARSPLVPRRVVRERNRAGAYTVMLLLGAGMLSMFYLLTLYMQIVRGYSAIHTGLAYLPFVAGVGVASGGLAPRLLAALPARAVGATGALLFSGAMAWEVAALSPASNYFEVLLPALFVSGLALGLVYVACTAVGMRGVAATDTGIAGGLVNTGLQLGASVGVSATAAIASIVTRSHLPGHAAGVAGFAPRAGTAAVAMTDGYVGGLLAGSIIAAAAAVVALIAINARLSADEIAVH
jgi:EmrB/QacA subfamily drug resistance transporter